MRKLVAFPLISLFAAAFLFVLAVPAFADGPSATDPINVFPITIGGLLAWGISSFVIPYVTAFVTAHNAPVWAASLVTAFQAFLAALVSWLVDVPGVPDFTHAIGLFTAIIGGAVIYRVGVEPTGAADHGTPNSLYDRGAQFGKSFAR